jgi:hypothetical protein
VSWFSAVVPENSLGLPVLLALCQSVAIATKVSDRVNHQMGTLYAQSQEALGEFGRASWVGVVSDFNLH